MTGNYYGYSDNTDRARALTPMVKVDPGVQRRAALYVASESHDAEDCATLLDMLGLNGRPMRTSEATKRKEHNLRAQARKARLRAAAKEEA